MKNLLFVLSVFITSYASSQERGNMFYGQHTIADVKPLNAPTDQTQIILSVKGLLNAEADDYVAFFHATQVGESIIQTNALMSGRIQKFKTQLALNSVDTLNVHRDLISFVPRYEYNLFNRIFSPNFNEVPDGFEMQINVSVHYKNKNQLDAIVTAAAVAEIYDLVKVDYFLTDVEAKYNELRGQCMSALTKRMQNLETLGIKHDTLHRTVAEDFGTILPYKRYGQYTAVARPSLGAATKSNTSSSGKLASTGTDSPTIYYHALPFENFDLVINPVIDKPVIQLTYEVKIAFNTQRVSKKEVLVVGNDGQLRAVSITP